MSECLSRIEKSDATAAEPLARSEVMLPASVMTFPLLTSMKKVLKTSPVVCIYAFSSIYAITVCIYEHNNIYANSSIYAYIYAITVYMLITSPRVNRAC